MWDAFFANIPGRKQSVPLIFSIKIVTIKKKKSSKSNFFVGSGQVCLATPRLAKNCKGLTLVGLEAV